ncbi:MAG: DUF4199 domain-containing protein [Ferruginibacter sp.]
MKQITARNIGIITGAAMIAFSMLIYKLKGSFDNNLPYITYAMYVGGILWALLNLKRLNDGAAGFKQLFAEGFKCFVLVTFLMVVFTLVFILMHPELKEQMAAGMRVELAKNKDFTPVDVEKSIATAKKLFLPGYIMAVVFSYLAIGAVVSAIGAAFLKQPQPVK